MDCYVAVGDDLLLFLLQIVAVVGVEESISNVRFLSPSFSHSLQVVVMANNAPSARQKKKTLSFASSALSSLHSWTVDVKTDNALLYNLLCFALEQWMNDFFLATS